MWVMLSLQAGELPLDALHRLDFKAFPVHVPVPDPVPEEMTNAQGLMTKE